VGDRQYERETVWETLPAVVLASASRGPVEARKQFGLGDARQVWWPASQGNLTNDSDL
jgi:hypothetical protein